MDLGLGEQEALERQREVPVCSALCGGDYWCCGGQEQCLGEEELGAQDGDVSKSESDDYGAEEEMSDGWMALDGCNILYGWNIKCTNLTASRLCSLIYCSCI